jgi:LemA protein
MSKGLIGCGVALLLLLAILAGAFMWFVGVRNGLVEAEEGVKAQWAQVENVYQRRLDLIPNLVETVKGYAAHEQETFTEVTEARSKASSIQVDPEKLMGNPAALAQFQQAQEGLAGALSRLMVVVEKYPDLKANQNFLDLQVQLEGTENRITQERRKFNEQAQGYNTRIRKFPASVVASMSGFDQIPYFDAAAGAEKAPEVKF